jgi:hypothetical protein
MVNLKMGAVATEVFTIEIYSLFAHIGAAVLVFAVATCEIGVAERAYTYYVSYF